MNAAKFSALPAIRANRLLAQFLRAQHDTVRAEVLLALRALQESVPLFSAVGLPDAHSGNSRFEATSLGEFDDVGRSLLRLSIQLRKSAAERFT